MSLSHEKARSLLDASLLKGLNPADRADLLRHLADCPECAAYQARHEKLDSRLRHALPARRPAYALSDADQKERTGQIKTRIRRKMASQKTISILRQAASLAAVLLLIAGLAWVFNNFIPQPLAASETPTAAPSPTLEAVAAPTDAPPEPAPTETLPINPDQIPFRILPDSLGWDPTGQWLAYLDNNGGVWIIRAEPKEEHRMVMPGVQVPASLQYAWSPDGSQLLVYGSWDTDAARMTGIWRVPVSAQGLGSVQEILPPSEANAPVYQNGGEVYAAAWSPDGKQLAYTFQGEAWVYRFDLGQSQRVTHLTENGLPRTQGSEAFDGVRDVIWSPDGQRLALELTCNCASPWSGVGVVNAASGEIRLLVDGGNDISWSPDGRILFRNATGDWASSNTYDFYAVTLDGSITNLTHSNPGYDPLLDPIDTYQESNYQVAGLQWGPDGKYLVETQSFGPDGLQAHSFIVRADPDTIVKEFFSDSREQTWQVFPTWLKDGRLAYLVTDPSSPDPSDPDQYRLRRIEIEGQAASEWGVDYRFRWAAWAPDGSALAMLQPADTHGQPERISFIILK